MQLREVMSINEIVQAIKDGFGVMVGMSDNYEDTGIPYDYVMLKIAGISYKYLFDEYRWRYIGEKR